MDRGRAELIGGGLATALLVGLHGVLLAHVGPLWRDEANSAFVSTMPTWADVWSFLQFDSFPILWFAIVRGWSAVGPAGSDAWLRVLGCLAGVAAVALLWWLARLFQVRAPVLGIALFGFSAAVIVHGDSLRAYGLGMAAGLATFGLLWRVAEGATPGRVAAALAGALALTQLVFYGPVYLLAAGVGGMAVAVRRARPRDAAAIAAIGVAAGLTYIPYQATFAKMAYWNEIVKYDIDLWWIYGKFAGGVAMNGSWALMAWFGAVAAGVVAAALAQSPARCPDATPRERDVALYCGVTLAVGCVVYVGFLLHLRYAMEPWYFLILMALIGGALDGAVHPFTKAGEWREARLVAALLLVAASFWPAYGWARVRKTNIDAVAATVTAAASPGDLVVLDPWTNGVSFHRYYHGPARWLTMPPLADLSVHRWEQLHDLMASDDAGRPVLDAVRDTLRGGKRVWLVGWYTSLPPEQAPIARVAARRPDEAWSGGRQYQEWSLQLGTLLARGSRATWEVPVALPAPQAVNPYENVPIRGFEGWRGDP